MPQPPADEPITKITFNVYTSDLAWLKKHFGQGWSTELRELIRDYRRKASGRSY